MTLAQNGIADHPELNGEEQEIDIEDHFFEQISEPASDQQSITRMMTGRIPEDILPVIQLEEFTPEERLHLEEVLRRTAEINEAEILRQQELKNELDSMVDSKEDPEKDNETACHCCGEPFSFLFNPKKQCGQCSLLVCGKCMNVFRKGVTQICRLCYVEDIHEGQTGKWFMVTLQKTGRHANFGCDILRASLRRQREEEEQVKKAEQTRLREREAQLAREAAAAAAAAEAAAAAATAETASKASSQKSAKTDRLSVASVATSKMRLFGRRKRGNDATDSVPSADAQSLEEISNRDSHEERAVDVDPTLASSEAASLPASEPESAATVPTITVEPHIDDKWTDRPFSVDESHIFPDDSADEDEPVGLRTPRSAVSHESLTSIYSDTSASYKLAVDVSGEIQVGLEYDFKHNIFFVKIQQCKDIAAVDSKRNKSDPYVKTYLLPDKTKVSKRKTSYRKGTLNPVFDEQVKYVISKSELDTRILSVAVWHRVALGHNIFLGETHIALEEQDFDDVTAKWYPLNEKKDIAIPMPLMMYKGDLVFAVKFMKPQVAGNEALGEVQVWVKQARNLIAATSNGYSDAFCKCYLLPDRSNAGKKKTRVIRRNLNPAWNTVLRFTKVSEAELSDRSLELTVWDYGRFRPNEFLGGLRLSLGLGVHNGQHVRWMDARGHEVTMWQAMMARPDAWIEGTLMLRPNMD